MQADFVGDESFIAFFRFWVCSRFCWTVTRFLNSSIDGDPGGMCRGMSWSYCDEGHKTGSFYYQLVIWCSTKAGAVRRSIQ